MTTQDKIQKIIEKSIEGGYLPKELKPISLNTFVFSLNLNATRVYWSIKVSDDLEIKAIESSVSGLFLDPLFWQALVSQISLDLKCGFVKCPAIGEHKKCVEEVAVRFFRINLDEGFDEAVDYIYKLIEK